MSQLVRYKYKVVHPPVQVRASFLARPWRRNTQSFHIDTLSVARTNGHAVAAAVASAKATPGPVVIYQTCRWLMPTFASNIEVIPV